VPDSESGKRLKKNGRANGFEPSTSNLSRCPGVTYGFSGRSQLDKLDKFMRNDWLRAVTAVAFFPSLADHTNTKATRHPA